MECSWPVVFDAMASIATVAALVLGGIWTWLLFVRQRLGQPKVVPRIECRPIRLSDSFLLHVSVLIENKGSVLVRLESAELRLRQMVPLPQGVESLIAEGYDPVEEGRVDISWPMLASREWSWKERELEIEPEETELLAADFFVSLNTEVVQFYLHIPNPAKKASKLGWPSTAIIELPEEEAPMADKMKPRSGQQKPEERQQPRQPAQKPQQSKPPKPKK